jgi:hypothetical protein
MPTKTPPKKTLTDQAAEFVEQMTPHVEAARERIVNEYLPVAQTVLTEAREAAIEVAKDARQAAQEAAANAEKSTRKSRRRAAKKAKAKARGAAAAVAATPAAVAVVHKVRPESAKPKRRKRFLLLLALVGAGAAVFKKLRGDRATMPSYTRPYAAPTPTAGSTGSTTASHVHVEPDSDLAADAMTDAGPGTQVEGTTDAGGAFLDEVAADADEQPHPVTTPDHPADVEDISRKS